MVNHSIYFREKSNFEEYTNPPSEANGECDCISPAYQMDFKLLESTTRFQASKELTNQIQKFCEGVTGHCTARKPNTKMQVTRLHAALRGCDCEELHDYLSKEYKYGTIENDIKTYVKLLTIKKNMLFFFPYRFSLKKQYSFKCAVESITSALEQDFKESNLFRGKYCMGYDTYLSYD